MGFIEKNIYDMMAKSLISGELPVSELFENEIEVLKKYYPETLNYLQ